ncbi:tetraacyldisaccharide 4'-kinase [uncultured Nevskia sp.]|uniref:tetraacyldisaccharide 4'-kinase n=1 Tax=uncultured Nevskia sp. TaxID=228950 RepID=UPI0025EAD226|nr:tetraacyldisaccharide 4'-kinase [uncultured Nevskia sp.]
MKRWIEQRWYSTEPPPLALRPLGALYGSIADHLAAAKKREAVRLPVPVVVVGNISVGGTGKTPLTLWLIEQARALGFTPGVISRGYGGRAAHYPLRVTSTTDPAECGDEPALIARRAGVPLAVAPDRIAAARLLIEQDGVDLLIADDGLQHYRLARDLELCVIDGVRGLGNGARLPAGPLREPTSRLATVDAVIVNGALQASLPAHGRPQLTMNLLVERALPLVGGEPRSLSSFAGQRVRAIAGIGHPQRFFKSLEAAGLVVIPQAFPDHHHYTAGDLSCDAGLPLLMTEKDAVKCAAFARDGLWWVPADAQLPEADAVHVRKLLSALKSHPIL